MNIKPIPIVVSLDELIEVRGGVPSDKNNGRDVEYLVELRDRINRLPRHIVEIGQKRIDGYPLTPVERKQLERFRKRHRNGGNGKYNI